MKLARGPAFNAMKRIGNLWPQVVSFDNLHHAARRALRGKRSRFEPCAFHANLETELLRLQRELSAGTYQPGGYRTFRIVDPKPRLISAAPFRDRVVHHALVQVLEPHFEPRFIHHSYACRPGKGSHAALAQFTKWARGTGHVLTMDVKKYFPSIDHQVLNELLRGRIKDPDLLWLTELIIDGSNAQDPTEDHFPGDDLFAPSERRKGLPIGNLTSQFPANVFLDPIDHFITARLGAQRYLRYMDDMAICDPDKGRLRVFRAAIRERLLQSRLRLNEGKSRLRNIKEGVAFVGFVVRPTNLRLSQTAVRRNRRRQRALQGPGVSPEQLAASDQAWRAHVRHGDTSGLVQALAPSCAEDQCSARVFQPARPTYGLRLAT